MRSLRRLLMVVVAVLVCGYFPPASAQDAERIPTAQEVKDLLAKEPFSDATWTAWRKRLLDWLGDKSRATDEAYFAARRFFKSKSDAAGDLPGPYSQDHLAWYFLSGGELMAVQDRGQMDAALQRSERALKQSLKLEPKFARAHRNLAGVYLARWRGDGDVLLSQAEAELTTARRLDPRLSLTLFDGKLAMARKQFRQAEDLFRKSLDEDGDNLEAATGLAEAIIINPGGQTGRAVRVRAIAERFPKDGILITMHALALAMDNQPRAAYEELQRARALGIDPAKFFPPDIIAGIEQAGAPGLLEQGAWIMLFFAGAYAAVMLLMALAGVLLAGWTRGTGALHLLKDASDQLLIDGQIGRAQGETAVARLYGIVLMFGLVLFYLAIPFVIAGLIWLTCLLLYAIFQLGRIPVKLVVVVAIVGFVGAWSVFKSLFSKPASGAFGLPKSGEQCPRVFALLGDVAGRVDTEPVDEVYIAPGAAIGVHQEGRGPFGVFGVKRRVLTLGLSTMRFLTIGELQSILAHEYAHFSHSDTFYSRFIYQVHLSIANALDGMMASGGALNYVNPFYWFLFLYYKCYSLLSSGFSRSREFLADRMACTLYGSDVFASALTKVSTDGTLFEMTMYDNIQNLLQEQKAFVNMYESFKEYRDSHLSREQREELHQKLLTEQGSLFASHPTFGERMQAVAELPKAGQTDSRPALALFDNADEIEKELTQFLTDYMAYIQQLQAQAAAAAQQA